MRVFEFVPEGEINCSVKAWIHDQNQSIYVEQRVLPAIIICPGGGYERVVDREAEPVANAYYAAGYNTYILTYSAGEDAKDFVPLKQLAATIAQIRANEETWYTDKNKIAVCGFSAGGHLAASLGTLFNEDKFLKAFGRDEHIRPDAMILGYPVITSDKYAHVWSIQNVSGAEKGSEEYTWFGLDKHVDEQTPPTFMWHTAEDKSVPVENSLKMAGALSKFKIPFEYHVFPDGRHGLSVCTVEIGRQHAYNARWVEWSICWLNKVFQFEL